MLGTIKMRYRVLLFKWFADDRIEWLEIGTINVPIVFIFVIAHISSVSIFRCVSPVDRDAHDSFHSSLCDLSSVDSMLD